MKILVTGGGTGGHVYPAISIADAIKEKYPNADILFVGTNRGLEADVVPKEGYAFENIEVKGFRRKLSLETIKTFGLMFKGYAQAGKIIKSFQPDLIVATGGYVSGPVVMQGFMKRIPSVVHEQNAIPGVTVKLLSKLTNKVLLSYEESKKYFKKQDNLAVVGNPVRNAFADLDKEACREKLGIHHPSIFIVGGSGGAASINKIAFEIIKAYNGKNVQVMHATGKRYYEEFIKTLEEAEIKLEDNVEVLNYVYDMPERMVACDMMVSRSGALSLSELALAGVPSILIPSPNVAHNHQEYNASVYEKRGAAVMLKEKDITANTVVDIVEAHLLDETKLETMRAHVKTLAKPKATTDILEIIESLMR